MTTRHAAALTLLGWYLMMPLMEKKGVEKKEVRISQWFIQKSFDTATECEAERSVLSQQGKEAYAKGNRERSTIQKVVAACIAADDPRLAK